ncbi:hypothetical protein HK102_004838 [Quaeritorhiza haematococci]|nr:hypothetical protein HK102_004838 [Quaeritorhiza haematococci]
MTYEVDVAQPVVIDYADLASDADLSTAIATAFGNLPSCLGICVVKNIPGYAPLRQRLLKLASTFAALPESAKEKCVHAESSYLFGWSHGKEIMNGRKDFAKGSYYNNPIYEKPAVASDPEYTKRFPEYGYANAWPEDLPEFRTAFMELGKFIVDVGLLLAGHCDKYLTSKFLELPPDFLRSGIADSQTIKARLLHYFPLSEEDVKGLDGGNFDSWCGLHVDHSMLTGLTSAMFMDESGSAPDTFTELDKKSPQLKAVLENAGLYIKSRGNKFLKVSIPDDCLAFQIGEASQVASNGLLVATPHLVRGATAPGLARNTFAVFMQPNVDHKLTPTMTFDEFTKEVMKRHY